MSCTILITGDTPQRISEMERKEDGSDGVSFRRVETTSELEPLLDGRNGTPMMVVAGAGSDGELLRSLRDKHPDVPFVLEAGARPPMGDRDLVGILERYDEMRTDFLGRLSHEVRSPLGVIVGVLGEIEATTKLDEDTRQLLRLADRSVRRLRNLSEGLMEVAELETLAPGERLQLDRQQVDARDVIRTAVERTQAAESRSNVRVAVQLPDEAVHASIDTRRMERVVSALVSNAIRFAQERAVVSLGQRDDALVIEVEDDGPGIPEGMRDGIFRRFVGRHLEGRKAGVAFGLSVAHDYVTAHGGEITVSDARPGQGDRRGTRVTVTIPDRDDN